MTVTRDKDGGLIIECDLTSEVEDLDTKDWSEVQEKKRELGWQSRQIDGEWIDICPEKVEELDEL